MSDKTGAEKCDIVKKLLTNVLVQCNDALEHSAEKRKAQREAHDN